MSGIERLLEVMRRLRDPENGCPWDVEQTFATIAPYTIEEAYEVADAIEREAWDDLEGEVGDLLLQVVYYAQMGAEQERFSFENIAGRIADKMIARHPHVFGDASVANAAAQTRAWEAVKAEERRRKADASGREASVLDDVPVGFPALMRAVKLQKRAARTGFDWTSAEPIMDKIREETAEIEAVLGGEPARVAEEIGDLLFSVVNLARHLGIDPETALRGTNAKFERRFRAMEQAARSNGGLDGMAIDALDALWERAKTEER